MTDWPAWKESLEDLMCMHCRLIGMGIEMWPCAHCRRPLCFKCWDRLGTDGARCRGCPDYLDRRKP